MLMAYAINVKLFEIQLPIIYKLFLKVKKEKIPSKFMLGFSGALACREPCTFYEQFEEEDFEISSYKL